MAILLDPARWPAHGTVFGHLVSDSTLDELHACALRAGLPARAFDHDHYDVPESRYDDVVAAGATLVGEKELIARLTASGLRVRSPDRTPTRATALRRVQERWAGLGLPVAVRDELIARWCEDGRHYHDVRHLWQCLAALEVLGSVDPIVELAAWFHDAVYDGLPGADEEASAVLAAELLADLLPADDVAEVQRLVRLTVDHRAGDPRGSLLSDADLSILGQIPGRYHVYARDVRLDYAHIDDGAWRVGRSLVLESLLAADPLFHTERGRELWDAQARVNLAAELRRLGPPA